MSILRARHGFAAILATVSALFITAATAAGAPLALPYQGPATSAASAGIRSAATRVKANDDIVRLRRGGQIEFQLPNARKYSYVVDLVEEHGNGISTLVGSSRERGAEHRVILTRGPNGTYASISTPEGEYRLVPGTGHDWLVDMAQERVLQPTGPLAANHAPLVPTTKRAAAPDLKAAVVQPSYQGFATLVPKATPTPQYVVDLMVVYSNGLATKLGANLMTRLHFLVARANTAFADSEIAITLRLVHAMPIEYDDGIADNTALERITPAHPSFNASVFGGVETARTQSGADLVTFLRDGANFGGNGAGWVGTSTPDANYMYSVTSGCVVGCEWIFIHQLGHNMGSTHDRPSTAVEAGGSSTYAQGAYPYSYGRYYCASGALSCNPNLPNNTPGGCSAFPECSTQNPSNFSTIMALLHNSAEKVYRFGNADLSCNASAGTSHPCGIASGTDSANDALSINNNRALLSSLKGAVVASGQPGSLQFTATAFSAAESAGTMTFTVSRVGGSTGAIGVTYVASNGTATAGQDFAAVSGNLSWADGDAASKSFTVPVTNDNVAEGNETFTVSLSSPTGPAGVYLGHPAKATGIILAAFPSGSGLPAGFTSTGGNAWTVASDQAYEGSTSLRSAQALTGDNTFSTTVTSDLVYTGTFVAGEAAFAFRVSSFQNAGRFQFLVDGAVVYSTSGETGWRLFTYPLSAGNHTLTWRFANTMPISCGSPQWNPPAEGGAACADRVWLDAVALPLAGETPPPPPPPTGVKRAFDFNGDSRSDIGWKHADGSAAMWLMDGTSVTGTALLFGGGSGWSMMQQGDFNGDNKSDIIWGNTDGSLAMWLMNGTSVSSTALLFGPGNGWVITHVADFNNDGKSDAILRHTDGSIAIWLLDGTTVTGGVLLSGAGSGWTVLKVGDFDGNGSADLIVQHTDGTLSMWVMNGLTITNTATLMGAGSGWTVGKTGDFNGDGKTDLVLRNTDGSTAIWVMNGTSPQDTALLFGGGSGWTVTLTGDFNGDGKSDLVFRNTDGSSAIWLMDNTTVIGTALLFGPGSGWIVTQLADFNNDNRADILWRHTDGSSAIWMMNSLTVTSTALLFGGGSGWSVVLGE